VASIYEMREKHRKQPKRDGLATLLDLIGRGVDVYSTIKGMGLAERQQDFAEEQAAAGSLAAQRVAAERAEDEYAKAALGLRGDGYTRPEGPREIDADWGKSLMDLLGELDRGELRAPEPEQEWGPDEEAIKRMEALDLFWAPTGPGKGEWRERPERGFTPPSVPGYRVGQTAPGKFTYLKDADAAGPKWAPSEADIESAANEDLVYFQTGDGRWQLRKSGEGALPTFGDMMKSGEGMVRTTHGTYGVPGKKGVAPAQVAAMAAMEASLRRDVPLAYVDLALSVEDKDEYGDLLNNLQDDGMLNERMLNALMQYGVWRFGVRPGDGGQ